MFTNSLLLFYVILAIGSFSSILIWARALSFKFVIPIRLLLSILAFVSAYTAGGQTLSLSDIDGLNISFAMLFVFIHLVGIVVLSTLLGDKVQRRNVQPLETVFYAFVSVPAQEFLFRAYIYIIVTSFYSGSFLIYMLISSAIFSIGHTVFRDKIFWSTSTLFGITMAALFWFVPNLLVVIIAHTVIGLIASSQ